MPYPTVVEAVVATADHLSSLHRRCHWADKSLDGFPPLLHCSHFWLPSCTLYHTQNPHGSYDTKDKLYLCLCLWDSLSLELPCLERHMAPLIQILFQKLPFFFEGWGSFHDHPRPTVFMPHIIFSPFFFFKWYVICHLCRGLISTKTRVYRNNHQALVI